MAYDFPDYHQVGDEWDKIDYDNLAQVTRTIALGLITIAGDPHAPQWKSAEPKAEKYLDAWKRLKN